MEEKGDAEKEKILQSNASGGFDAICDITGTLTWHVNGAALCISPPEPAA